MSEHETEKPAEPAEKGKRAPTLNERIGKVKGKPLTVNDVLDKEITIEGFTLSHSNQYDCEVAEIAAVVSGYKAYIQTFSAVLIEHLKNYKELMPFRAKIIKKKNYYDLESP